MQILKNRAVAVVIVLIVALLSTIYSVNRTLGARVAAVEDGFYTGVLYEGYTRKSAASQLRMRADAAGGLISVGGEYESLKSLCRDLADARNALEELLNNEGSIQAMYKVNTALETAFDALLEGLYDVGMTDRDADSAALYLENFDGAAKVIRNCAYNDAVRQFKRETLEQFPTRLLASVSFVDAPETFE